MKQCKRNEVPKEYRRNIKKEVIFAIQAFALCTIMIFFFGFMLLVF